MYANDTFIREYVGENDSNLNISVSFNSIISAHSKHQGLAVQISETPLDFMGFRISGDSCIIVADTYGMNFPMSPDDTSKFDTLRIVAGTPAERTSMKLKNQPLLVAGEIVEGELQFKSIDYWDWKEINPKKYRIEVKAYFRVRVPEEARR